MVGLDKIIYFFFTGILSVLLGHIFYVIMYAAPYYFFSMDMHAFLGIQYYIYIVPFISLIVNIWLLIERDHWLEQISH